LKVFDAKGEFELPVRPIKREEYRANRTYNGRTGRLYSKVRWWYQHWNLSQIM